MKNIEEKKKVMEEQISVLCAKIDDGDMLTEHEQMAYDIYSWLLDDTDQPEID